MTLREVLIKEGTWLFRWRSYLPLALLAPTVAAMWHYQWPNNSETLQNGWEATCLTISLLGLVIRVVTVGFVPPGTSGRNTKYQLACSLNTTGMYSIVRNPLYLGNYLMFLGVTLFPRTWWLPAIMTLLFWLYYERIILAEEAYLRRTFGGPFDDWAAATPAFIPDPRKWQKPALPFSFKTVLRREYPGLMGIAIVFFGLEVIEHYQVEHRLHAESPWLVLVVCSALLFLVLRTLKRRTTVLDIDQR